MFQSLGTSLPIRRWAMRRAKREVMRRAGPAARGCSHPHVLLLHLHLVPWECWGNYKQETAVTGSASLAGWQTLCVSQRACARLLEILCFRANSAAVYLAQIVSFALFVIA